MGGGGSGGYHCDGSRCQKRRAGSSAKEIQWGKWICALSELGCRGEVVVLRWS